MSTVNDETPPASSENGESSTPFLVVGIGASAGGLQAFRQFFDALPAKSDMAFVLLQHLDPNHESELAELLQNSTSMQVRSIEDGTEVEPNHIYVTPPGTSLTIENATLYLSEPMEKRGHRAPIDLFFRSLAEDQGENAVCIILSGTGSDGTLGLKAIKERAGVTMAQDPDEAEYDGMPRNAVATGLVDLTLPVRELAEKLVAYKNTASKIQLPNMADALPDDDSKALQHIFAQLRAKTGHGFSNYKRSTILRRIGRRLQVNQIEDLPAYLHYLRNNEGEAEALFKDFLISVTNFFRDPDVFEMVKANVIPRLFEGKTEESQIRVWVPGCATGEEAYSIAILLCEHAATLENPPDFQIFATDIDEEAIAFAREGAYSENIATDVSPERLEQFFTQHHEGYQVKTQIRRMVLFAAHNLITDPPFSKLDLISCRNLLIYFNRDIQHQIFELFHYALLPERFLMLGSSESPQDGTRLFTLVNKKRRIYQHRHVAPDALRFPRISFTGAAAAYSHKAPTVATSPALPSFDDIHRRLLLEQYAPLSVVVDENYEIIHVSKSDSLYLRFAEGTPTNNILQVVHPGLRIELRTALFTAFRKEKTAQAKRVQFAEHGTEQVVNLVVQPIHIEAYDEGYVQVIFEEATSLEHRADNSTPAESVDASLVEQLEAELHHTTHQLQTTIENYETSNEELKASNEELQSMNEELQSTTEELETGKEELQSMNEELVTVNQELKSKIEKLNRSNSDLHNLMAATEIATLFLDRDLLIKRFTPRLAEVFNILHTDVDRPLAHLTHTLSYPALLDDARQVLVDLFVREREVTSEDGRWYLAQIRPYCTLDDRIDGVVLTFIDITERKQAAEKDRFQAYILNHINDGVIALDNDRRVLYINKALADLVGVDLQTAPGKPLSALYNYRWVQSKDEAAVYASLEKTGVSEGEVILETYDGRSIHAELSVSVLTNENRELTGRLATIRDITERRRAEQQQRQAEMQYRRLVENIREYAILLLDTDGRISAANPGAEAVMGYSEDDLMEQPFNIIFTAEDRAARLPEQELQQAVEQGSAGNEGWRLRKDGSLFWANGVLTAIKNSEGTPTGFIKVIRDTTERKEAEELLNQRARQQAIVAELGLFALSSTNLQDLMDRAVSRVADTLGVEYCKVLELQPDRKTLLLRAGIGWQEGLVGQATVGTGKNSQAGYTLRANEAVIVNNLAEEARFNGPALLREHNVVSGVSVVIQSEDHPYGVMGAHTPEHRTFTKQDADFLQAIANIIGDAIRRLRSEEALRESKERFQAVTETVPAIIFTINADIQVEYLNQRWTAFTGLSLEEGLGTAWEEVLHPEDRDRVRAQWRRARAIGDHFEDRQRLRAADGSYRWILVRAQPIVTPEGAVTRWFGTATDINNLVEAEQEIHQLNETLEERVRIRTEQVRSLASALTLAEQQERRRIAQILHDDLQQMLYGLDMATQQLRRHPLSDQQERLVQQSEDILDQAIETTRSLTVDLSPPVLRGEGLDAAFEWLAVQMDKVHHLDVVIEVKSPVIIPSEDMRVLLFQLVRELLFNVIKHADVKQARVELSMADDEAVIAVVDNGVGFVPKNKRPVTETRPADGFGLVSVQERLGLFGGRLEIDSAPGRGTRMTIMVPIQETRPNTKEQGEV